MTNRHSRTLSSTDHFGEVKMIVIDGNCLYAVVADGKIRYNGNNPAKFYWVKFIYKRRSKVFTTIKHGSRQSR